MKIFYMNIEEINAILVIINECGSFYFLKEFYKKSKDAIANYDIILILVRPLEKCYRSPQQP